MSARDIIKAEAERLLDHTTHNIGTKISWEMVNKGLKRILETIDAGKTDGWASAQAKDMEAEVASRMTAWRRTKEAEDRAKGAEERANASDAAFKKLHSEFMVAQQTISRLRNELENNSVQAQLEQAKEALGKAVPILEALDKHVPAEHEDETVDAENGKATLRISDGGFSVPLEGVMNEQVEIALGAMIGVAR